MNKLFRLCVCAGLACLTPLAIAAPPPTINYQGYLTSASSIPVTSPALSMTFSLFAESSGGSPLWSETQSVTVTNGVFSVALGNGTPVGASPALGSLAFNAPYYLDVAVGAETFTSRVALSSGPYAFRAVSAGSADALSASATIPVAQVIGTVPGSQGPTGPTGAQGPQGQTGADRIYGDGSAGPLNLTSNANWNFSGITNLQFTDCTIAAGVTLMVPSGTVIRCNGTFTNLGTITVNGGPPGGYTTCFVVPTDNLAQTIMLRPSPPSIAATPPTLATCSYSHAGNPIAAYGGGGGTGAINRAAIYQPGPNAGAAAFLGNSGGGSLVVLARGAFTLANGALIDASGAQGGLSAGAGGAGGGVVVLASATSISVAAGATIVARGGPGGDGQLAPSPKGAGGGGGGGFIRLIAPGVNSAGTLDVSAGAAGAQPAGTPVGAEYSGGSGGGGSIGYGGTGSTVESTGITGATAGTIGAIITDKGVDPGAFF